MLSERLIGHIFFFGVLVGVTFLMWELIAPFGGALALAAIIVTVCYPLYERILKIVAHKTLASFLALLSVILVVVIPLSILAIFIVREAASIYTLFSSGTYQSLTGNIKYLEELVQRYVPEFSLNVAALIEQVAGFLSTHIVGFFTGTATTVFLFFIALIASFYFFRDGKTFTTYLIQISPLQNKEDELIVRRLATAIRSVALGTVLVALIQGTMTGVGLALFGFDRAVLWGSVAAIGALIPGLGTTIVFIPAVIYLIMTGSYFAAGGVALWGVLAVGIIDNIIGPYFMSRGNSLHPFLILLSVLGGIALFGPLGFIIGPVVLSLFTVLIEIYATQIRKT